MRKNKDLTFKKTEDERLIRAHLAMGIPVRVEVTPDGTLRPNPLKPIAAGENPKAAAVPGLRKWDE